MIEEHYDSMWDSSKTTINLNGYIKWNMFLSSLKIELLNKL